MIILNKMYTGRYIAQEGKLGHEAINLVRADDQRFYIWLNSMGICCQTGVDGCTVLMVRCINSQLYKVLAKAENCTLCDGASIPRKKDNGNAQGSDRENADGTRESDQTKRYDQQKAFGVRYNGKCPMDDIYDEQDMFATFCSDTVCVPEGDVYLTTNAARHDPQNGVFFADFKMCETMRAYIKESHTAYAALEEAMGKIPWTVIEEPDLSTIRPPEFHFFKLIRKEKDELAFSNALAYYIKKIGIQTFLKDCITTEAAFWEDRYELLREKNNIDISLFGEKYVVIIENKIDSYITYNSNIKLDAQKKRAVELYFPHLKEDEKNEMIDKLSEIISAYQGDASQLSKYYLYAVAYLLSQNLGAEEIHNHIKCFLLIPRYAKKYFGADPKGYFDSSFLLSEKYKIITYSEIYDYLDRYKETVNDGYLADFLSAVAPLKKEFDNELEEEMKYRFYKAIGKV